MASLIYHYAAMNAGKTASLLTAAYSYKERGMSVLLLKPVIDNRDSESEIKSRIGISQEANLVTADITCLNSINGPSLKRISIVSWSMKLNFCYQSKLTS